MRSLGLAEAMRLARSGSQTERMILERTFGKLVWEALLQNPSLSIPEVARIAGNGTVPQPVLEQIVANPGWVRSDEVRKRLLGNPRLRGQAHTVELNLEPSEGSALFHECRHGPATEIVPAFVDELLMRNAA